MESEEKFVFDFPFWNVLAHKDELFFAESGDNVLSDVISAVNNRLLRNYYT